MEEQQDRIDLDPVAIERRRARVQAQLWRDAVEAEARAERTRVVPLPLTIAAVLLPFLAAWASAGAPPSGAPAPSESLAELIHGPLPEPLRHLGRHDRAPETPGGYVDVWGAPAPWEARVLRERGHVRPGR